jgi:two-component system chemotaxis sensor kinase CheA
MSETGLREVFLEESREILENLESDIVRLEENYDRELIDNIFRYVHTLKGSSGIAGFNDLYEFAHQLENLLDLVRSEELSVEAGIIDIILNSVDWIKLSIFGGDRAENLDRLKESLLGEIIKYINRESTEGIDEGVSAHEESDDEKGKQTEIQTQHQIEEGVGYRYFTIRAEFKEGIFENGIDPLCIMGDLASHGTVIKLRVNRKRLPDFHEMDPEKCYIGWEVILKTKHPREDIMKVFLFVRDDNEISVEDITSTYVEDDEYVKEKRIGEILVSKGIITDEEFNEIIHDQELKNKKFGERVVEKGYATESDIQYALKEQEVIKNRIERETVRVDTGRLDKLMNLLGEVVIGQSSIKRIADELDQEMGYRLNNALYGIDRITREFQEQIMSIRMIPIGPTFEQFRRFVRDAANTSGKSITLEIEGKETELDKTVIEKISDPLKHMIRNAIDHGIETPDERIRAGKDRAGRIALRAYHQEGSVYIEVADDGRGIDRGKIRERAISRGLMSPDDEPADERLLAFLFIPGFSTAENVGDLSGRGVGMDVVKTNIEALRGTVGIESEGGAGTLFRIKLPLTLAIIEGMLVRVGEHRYIIPLLSIVESLQPREEDLKTVEGKGEVVQVRGEYVTLLRLYDLFGVIPEMTEPWNALVVIVESSGTWLGLLVDELLGQQQIVIKNLGSQITESRALSGAAILGDGQVALIMDVHGLVGEISR